MSMFHELMMRKKEQIMYATIKGSLTENDGVFSGFSDSNYLALQNSFKLNANTIAEFKFKVNLTSVSVVSGILSTSNNYGMQFACTNDSKLTLYLGNNSSWTILSAKKGTTTIQANTDYYIRLLIDKGTITLLLSTDDITYTTEFTAVVTISEEYTYNLGYGKGRATNQYCRGSIDLPNSYIKLGATKYKLQAVVGYTVVGSPTIVDGVVSGFSSENYLTIGSSFSSDDYDVIEFNTKITTGNSIADGLIIGLTTYYVVGLAIINSKFYCRTNFGSYSNAISDITPQANTTYTIKGIIDKKNSTVSINVNGTKNSETFTYDSARSGQYRSGYSSSIGTFNGSIDLNSTNIKRNNKLWFNGQQA